MFSKFTSMLHNAVGALAPHTPLQQDFVSHWKAVMHYFVDNKEHKMSIEHTELPNHLNAMMRVLQEEEELFGSGASTGPCMEYMLQHRILETLYTLARTDCPPGMRQTVLQFFTKLLSWTSQPLLPHINVHRPVYRLMRLCGETKAAPTESEEIQFLCTVCAKLKQDPYLVNFFIESVEDHLGGAEEAQSSSWCPGSPSANVFPLVDSLLSLMHSPDARVGVKACEGLMLCASLPEHSSAACIVHRSFFCRQLTGQLCDLYNKLPKSMDPMDIDSVDAKWGLDIISASEDYLNFPGKRQLISFLSWFDYCDQLMKMAHPEVATALTKVIRQNFLEAIVEPAILQTSEAGATTATAHLCKCVRLVSSPLLLKEMVSFILGDELGPEVTWKKPHTLRQRLIERCNHLSDEMCVTSLKLFETLLQKPHAHIMHNLVLCNLLGQGYMTDMPTSPRPPSHSSSRNSESDPGSPRKGWNHIDNTEISELSLEENVNAENVSSHSDSENEINNEETSKKKSEIINRNNRVLQNESRPSCNSIAESVMRNPGESESLAQNEENECRDLEQRQNESISKQNQRKFNQQNKSDDQMVCEQKEREIKDQGSAESESELESVALSSSSALQIASPSSVSELDLQDHMQDKDDSLGFDTDFSPPSSPSRGPSVHKVVNSFLSLVPEYVKSSFSTGDSGYDTYLRDAHRQFSELQKQVACMNWPQDPLQLDEYTTDEFYEGAFLRVLMDKLSMLLDQSYDVNLQVTSVISHLALLPHPNLHEYLLNPYLPLQPGAKTLTVTLNKVVHDMKSRLSNVPDYQKRLIVVRRQLMGVANNFRRVEDSNLLEGVIVLEEFCKELAAIAFVKHHSLTV